MQGDCKLCRLVIDAILDASGGKIEVSDVAVTFNLHIIRHLDLKYSGFMGLKIETKVDGTKFEAPFTLALLSKSTFLITNYGEAAVC